MPYQWSDTPQGPIVLTLRAHRSLSPRGFALMILITSGMLVLPLLGLLGQGALWWMLPFLVAAVAALWFALRRSYRDGYVSEVLRRDGDQLTLTHTPARGASLNWQCNIYWARAEMHVTGGPVAHYITLSGNRRQVEIGAFLSEEERIALFDELTRYLGDPRQGQAQYPKTPRF